MKKPVLVGWMLAAGLAACGKQETPPVKTSVPSKPVMPALAIESPATTAQPTAPVLSGDPPAKIEPATGAKLPPAVARDLGTDGQPNLQALTAAMQDWCYHTDRFPTNVEELVASKYLASIPTPPAGQKYVINPSRNCVELGAK